MKDSDSISFSIFDDEQELSRWISFANSYMNKDEYTTTVETGYSNPIEHREEIHELLELIHKRNKRLRTHEV